jgi:Leucine-rich repeat (LRR) protein
VNKCTSLIKLDLSSNQLAELPLRFGSFPHLRILYLHDNQLTACPIAKTNLDYVSIFDNPLKDYRRSLIDQNEKLLAIDLHVVTRQERLLQDGPRTHTLLKWPIVEISQSLEQEEDYLNLLKAELFVITQVHKRANYIDFISSYLASFSVTLHFHKIKHTVTNLTFLRIEEARKAATHWI